MRAIALLLLLAGCGAPEVALEKLPPPAGPSGEVVIVRPSAFIGDELAYVVNVDQRNIHELETKQHIRVRLGAGAHRIALRCWQVALAEWKETAITHEVLAGATTYLRVTPRHACAELEPLPQAEGRRLAAGTVFKPH
jgi:hypothetical protein